MSNLEAIYLRLPIFLQNLVVGIEGRKLDRRRYGGGFSRLADEARRRELLSPQQLESYRCDRLKRHLEVATSTHYWRQKFKQFGVDVKSDDPFSELRKLPVISKDEVKKASREISNAAISDKDLLPRHTSGTTGSGLIFHETREMEQVTWATWWRYRNWHGIHKDDWCGYFGGRSVVPLSQRRPPYWRVNRAGRQILFSGYHLSRETAPDYAKAVQDNAIEWLHGYPSMLAVFAGFLLELGLEVSCVRVVTTGAENLLTQQKALIQKAFGARVVQHYGQAEGVANISECPAGRLHVDEDYSGVEFVPLESDASTFRIVGTNWHNPAFPILRYDTGDLAVLSPDQQCVCGRPGRLVQSIDGRKEDVVVLPNGARVGRMDHIFKDMVNIREAQIVQNRDTSLVIRVVRGEGYTDRDEGVLIKEFRKRVGNEVELAISYVESIPRTRTGKLRFVVSEANADA